MKTHHCKICGRATAPTELYRGVCCFCLRVYNDRQAKVTVGIFFGVIMATLVVGVIALWVTTNV